MPIYAYRCASCGHSRDVLQKMSDPVLSVCPVCGADQFQKQVTAAGFQLKGSGWYATDFKGGGAAPAKPDATPAAGDGAAPTPPASPASSPASASDAKGSNAGAGGAAASSGSSAVAKSDGGGSSAGASASSSPGSAGR